MNQLPTELFLKITSKLTITDLKNIALTCQIIHYNIYNYNFLKIFIQDNFPKYELCDEKLIWKQFIYLYKFHKKENCDVHRLSNSNLKLYTEHSDNKFVINAELHPGTKLYDIFINTPDRYYYTYDNSKYIYYDKNIIKKLDALNKTIYIIPKKIKLIDELPLHYFHNIIYQYIFYFDVTPYMDQIRKNIRQNKYYVTKFKHEIGKWYTIIYYASKKFDTEEFIKQISNGYFYLAKNSNKMIINDRVLKFYLSKLLNPIFMCRA